LVIAKPRVGNPAVDGGEETRYLHRTAEMKFDFGEEARQA
jgi:hypothetical protein